MARPLNSQNKFPTFSRKIRHIALAESSEQIEQFPKFRARKSPKLPTPRSPLDESRACYSNHSPPYPCFLKDDVDKGLLEGLLRIRLQRRIEIASDCVWM